MTSHLDAPVTLEGHRGVDAPGGRPWLAPAGVGAGLSLAVGVLAVRSPYGTGSYGACPFLALTGLWCPACGGLRAVHELTRLDVGAAVAMNPWVVVGIPVLVALWGWWLARGLGLVRPDGPLTAVVGRLLSTRGALVFAGLTLVFWVIRNLPAGAVLAPG